MTESILNSIASQTERQNPTLSLPLPQPLAQVSPMVPLGLERMANQAVGKRHVERVCYNGKDLALMHRYVLALRLSGHAVSEDKPGRASICSKTGYTAATIYRILGREDVQAMRDIMLSGYESSFKSMLPQVIEVIERGIAGQQVSKTELDSATLWLKYNMSTPEDKGAKVTLTAEQIVFNILQQANQRMREQDAA